MLNKKMAAGIAGLSAMGLILAGCAGDGPGADAVKKETSAKMSSYDTLSKNQPAHTMDYSPTRATINFWADTWDEPGKLSYVYFQNANGDLIGYYIFEGLPVNYNAMLTPNYLLVDTPDDEDDIKNQQVPAPGIDGVYYQGSGGGSNTFYGKDATTGAYIEYTTGMGMNTFLTDAPLPRSGEVPALGPTTIDDVK